jgi:hypothetical protein
MTADEFIALFRFLEKEYNPDGSFVFLIHVDAWKEIRVGALIEERWERTRAHRAKYPQKRGRK